LMSSISLLFPVYSGISAGPLFFLSHAFTLVSCLVYHSVLKMEATCSSETSVDFQRTTRRNVPEDRTLRVPCSIYFSSNIYNKKITNL
jgi:hypothetical protein